MPQRLTLTDIADQAGVSTATVSRVLNGKSNVADSTRRQHSTSWAMNDPSPCTKPPGASWD